MLFFFLIRDMSQDITLAKGQYFYESPTLRMEAIYFKRYQI